jgi:AcrR family transcriptional regulator
MGMPEQVIEATLRVIESGGLKDVTVRRVADEIGRSTTVVTHYFPTREDLLVSALGSSFAHTKAEANQAMEESDDPLWAFLNWSVSVHHRGVWLELMAASVAGIEASVSRQVDEILEWWDAQLLELLEGRIAPGRTPQEVCDIMGIVVDGILFASNRDLPSRLNAEDLLSATILHLLTKQP